MSLLSLARNECQELLDALNKGPRQEITIAYIDDRRSHAGPSRLANLRLYAA